jgi:hypothetical protein
MKIPLWRSRNMSEIPVLWHLVSVNPNDNEVDNSRLMLRLGCYLL